MLAPVVGLNLWSFFMESWMYATRIPAISKYNVTVSPYATKEEFNAKIPKPVQWKADNYNHLMEQPTQFYAIALTLAFLDAGDVINQRLAWTYVGLRIAHSLVQATVNKIMLRWSIFVGSSFVLLGMTARAAILLFN